SASMSTATGVLDGNRVGILNARRIGIVGVFGSTTAGRDTTLSSALCAALGAETRWAPAPTITRIASASGTEATTSSRLRSMTRSTGSVALGSTKSPGL